jgi:ATP/maltotriose-dependent transcriptional regulator MalT
LALERARGDPVDVAFALAGLATVAHHRGDLTQAAALHSEALALRRQLDPRSYAVAGTLSGLGTVLADLGESGRAIELLQESLALRTKHEEKLGIAQSIEGLAGLAATHGQPQLAARLLGATAALRESMGTAPTAIERERRDRALATASLAIGGLAADTAFSQGREIPLSAAIAEAARIAPTIPSRPPGESSSPTASVDDFGLSARELDVLRLLVEGRSNREIGDALSISHRTVMVHVSNIIAKFAVTSRTAAVGFALTHGLVPS